MLYKPVYPFDTLTVKRVLERNRFTQTQLEANEQGLRTRYYYTAPKLISNVDLACYANNYSSKESFNIGIPVAVTVGYGRNDSLRTDYAYYPDYSVKKITDPNGITLSYAYDEFGRLKGSYRNGDLLSINKYNTWNNDDNLTFTNRALQNYVETYQFKDKGSASALQSRKYIDPLGRDFHTMSREVPDAFNLQTTAPEVVHTGTAIYDNWNRVIEAYKPFVDGDGITPVTWGYVPQTTNPAAYPHISSFAGYENNQKSRVLREAKPGEVLNTNHNVKYTYSMANYICGGCELALSIDNTRLIMGSNPNGFTYKVVEVEDEDGKISKEYFNALGQKVATKQFIGATEAITLFVYDSYGNLTKVINPNQQESNYTYNIMGWLIEKETVDGGTTKYMYNQSGQVVLEQDENARKERSCQEELVYDPDSGQYVNDFVDQPYYRKYTYDIFGRLVLQEKQYYELALTDFDFQLPMLYNTTLHNYSVNNVNQGDNLFNDEDYYFPTANTTIFPKNAFVYKFTNKSTYAWEAVSYIVADIGNPPSSNVIGLEKHYNVDLVAQSGISFIEKRLFYNKIILPTALLDNLHTNTANILTTSRANLKGNLSHTITYNNAYCQQAEKPVKFDFYSYNDDGNLLWQIQQFNANGITATAKGLVSRIDYPQYDLNNNLLVENIDINNDLVLDMQYHYTYDLRNRLKEVRVSLDNSQQNGQLVASYSYNDATGLVTKTNYHKDCTTNNLEVDEIEYLYDVRDRLTDINSSFFDYQLFYDNNMPTTQAGNLNTIANFNGNINGTKATYKLLNNMHNYVAGSRFEQPTTYAYHYDGINRLTAADAFWDETALIPLVALATFGDVTYAYDKIGNLTHLSRHIDPLLNTHEWNYKYQQGTNRLTKVETQNTHTTDRNYTYDAAGNLLTDDYRNLNSSIYGRGNLPFNVALDNKATQYLYDAADARVFKGLYNFTTTDQLGVSNLGVALSAEYYLKDAAGNTLGILNYNTNTWTWYVFGRERFARITPNGNQQPVFYAADNQRLSDTLSNEHTQQFINELNSVLESDSTTQTQLMKIMLIDSTTFWISEENFTIFTDTMPDSTYTILDELTLTGTNQLVNLNGQLISAGVLTGRDTALADNIIIGDTLYNERVITDPIGPVGPGDPVDPVDPDPVDPDPIDPDDPIDHSDPSGNITFNYIHFGVLGTVSESL